MMFSQSRARYSRQVALQQIGRRGQERLAAVTVTIVGCGGLGTVSAGLLGRAGVAHLRLVDDDTVEISNLHRQVLYDEGDLGRPKVVAAAEKLRAINGDVAVQPVIARLNPRNATALLAGSDLVLDGTDNDSSRYVINEVCISERIPWVFAAVDGSYGLAMAIVPGETPCFCCAFGDSISSSAPSQGDKGILGAAAHMVAAIQASQALRILLGAGYAKGLIHLDGWYPCLESIEVKRQPGGCRFCGGQSQPAPPRVAQSWAAAPPVLARGTPKAFLAPEAQFPCSFDHPM
jgi:adenylyltransferase/sulfurtransferase